MHPAPVCGDVQATLASGNIHVDQQGDADVELSASVVDPGGGTVPARASVALKHLAYEPDGAGELVDHPNGEDLVPIRLHHVPGGTPRKARFAAARRPHQPAITASLVSKKRGRLRLRVRVHGARLEGPHACIGSHAQHRVTLQTLLRIAYPSGQRASEALHGQWHCKAHGLRLR